MGFFDTLGNMFGLGGSNNSLNFQAQAPQFVSQDYLQGLENQAQSAQNRPDTSSFAQALLNQSLDAQNAQANALAASSKGNVSPALLQRQAMRQQAQAAGQAAGQSGVISAQEALQNRQLNDQMALQYRNMGLNAAQSQANANLQAQGVNANLAAKNAEMQNGNITGALNKIGGAITSGGLGGIFGGGAGGGAAAMAGGADASSLADLAIMAAAHGAVVPGHAKVAGDSPQNDTIPAMLSPGEIVIPRSKAEDPEKAKEFIEHLKGSKNKKEVGSYGKILEAQRKLKSLVDELGKTLSSQKE